VTARLAAGGVVLLTAAAVAAAGWTRARAVQRLPADFDELVYAPVAYWYAARMAPGRWAEIPLEKENAEHPPLVKLLYAAELRRSRVPEPDWEKVRVGQPLSPDVAAALAGPRTLSAAGGVVQVLLTALASPVGALWLAFDTYHVKYSAEAMLEGVAGVFAILAVLLLERARRRQAGPGAIDPGPVRGPLLGSAAALAMATACKLPFGLVTGLGILPFLVAATRGRPRLLAAYAVVGLGVFLAADPALWPDPAGVLGDAVVFHFRYAVTDHVKRAGLPWWQPLAWLSHSAPDRWHPGVFPVSFPDSLLLVAAALAAPWAWRRRGPWLALAAAGLAFLLAWPTKWPQYTVMLRPALAICAGAGLEALAVAVLRRVQGRRGIAAAGR